MDLIFLYIEKMIPYILIALPIFLICRFIFIKKTNKNIRFIDELILTIFILYIVGIISQTIIPKYNIGIYSGSGKFFFNMDISINKSNINLIPFNTIYQYLFTFNPLVSDWKSVSILNISSSILLFLPFGILVPLIWKKYDSFKSITLLGLSMILSIEFIQFFIGRIADIDDIILAMIGINLGYIIYLQIKKFRKIN